MKAAAVERLTPAKQWISSGSARSQSPNECRGARCTWRSPGRMWPSIGSTMSDMAMNRCRSGRDRRRARHRRALIEQRHQRARAGLLDGLADAAERSRREGGLLSCGVHRMGFSGGWRRLGMVVEFGEAAEESFPAPWPAASARDRRRRRASAMSGAPNSFCASAMEKPASARRLELGRRAIGVFDQRDGFRRRLRRAGRSGDGSRRAGAPRSPCNRRRSPP